MSIRRLVAVTLTVAAVMGAVAVRGLATSQQFTVCVTSAGTVTAADSGDCAVGESVDLATADAARLLGEQLADTRAAFAPRALDVRSEAWRSGGIRGDDGELHDAILNVWATVAWLSPHSAVKYEWVIDGDLSGELDEGRRADARGDVHIGIGAFACPEGSEFELRVAGTDWFGAPARAAVMSGVCGPEA